MSHSLDEILKEIEKLTVSKTAGPTLLANLYRIDVPRLLAAVRLLREQRDMTHRELCDADGNCGLIQKQDEAVAKILEQA